jgi:hypothetical protein
VPDLGEHDDASTPSGLFDPEANMTAAAVTTL